MGIKFVKMFFLNSRSRLKVLLLSKVFLIPVFCHCQYNELIDENLSVLTDKIKLSKELLTKGVDSMKLEITHNKLFGFRKGRTMFARVDLNVVTYSWMDKHGVTYSKEAFIFEKNNLTSYIRESKGNTTHLQHFDYDTIGRIKISESSYNLISYEYSENKISISKTNKINNENLKLEATVSEDQIKIDYPGYTLDKTFYFDSLGNCIREERENIDVLFVTDCSVINRLKKCRSYSINKDNLDTTFINIKTFNDESLSQISFVRSGQKSCYYYNSDKFLLNEIIFNSKNKIESKKRFIYWLDEIEISAA